MSNTESDLFIKILPDVWSVMETRVVSLMNWDWLKQTLMVFYEVSKSPAMCTLRTEGLCWVLVFYGCHKQILTTNLEVNKNSLSLFLSQKSKIRLTGLR